MARARNLKPGFFRNEVLAECGPWARLLFAGLWTIADREGRLEDRSKRIKADLFPYDADVDVEQCLQDLAQRDFIVRYVVGEQRLIQVVSFARHQTPHHREADSTLPPEPSPGLARGMAQVEPTAEPQHNPGPDLALPVPSRASSLIPSSLIPSSLNPGVAADFAPAAPEIAAAEDRTAVPAKTKLAAATKAPKREAETAQVWAAYAAAHERRYGVAPVRNAKVNAQLKQLVERIGVEEAPQVAAFYLDDLSTFYASRMHALDILLRDAETLRTRWATSKRGPTDGVPKWLAGTGFGSAYEAENAGCGPGNASQFRDGQRVHA